MATIAILGLTRWRPQDEHCAAADGRANDGRDTPHGSADRCRGHRRRRQDPRRGELCADLPSLARLQHPRRARPGARTRGFSALQPPLRAGWHPSKSTRHPEFPEITMLGINKFDADGKLNDAIYRRGAEGWHTDGAYNQQPFKATQLYALAVPSR